MPVQFPEFRGSESDPRDALRRFVSTVREFLAEIIQSNQDPFGRPLFWQELLTPMRDAWDELKRNDNFGTVDGLIREISATGLGDHGLSGQQLAFKLAVIRVFHGRYLSIGKGILRKLLNIIDDLLKSILDAAGAGGAILEIKDFIKDSIDDETSIP
jgi:hypothetical protein